MEPAVQAQQIAALLERGADVNHVCKRSGSTPLHRAVTFTGARRTAGRPDEQIEIIQLLIAGGAEASIENRLGKTPIDYAVAPEIRQLLVGD